MNDNSNIVAIDITADPSKAEKGFARVLKGVDKLDGAADQAKRAMRGMFDIKSSSGNYRGLVNAAAATTRKYATATELARHEMKSLENQFKNTTLDAKIYNRAMAAQRKILASSAVATKTQASAIGRLTAKVRGLSLGYYALGAAMAVAFAARGVKVHLDSYSSLQSQLKLIVGEHGNVNAAMQKNFELSKKTFGSFDGTVNAYARISRSVKQLNKSEAARLQVVSNINKAMAIGGTTAQEAKSAITQLGQGLASDRLAGDELKSILENAPRLAEAIANGMDVSIGKLREMGAAGELTSQKVFEALLSQTQKLDKEFESVAKKIDQSMIGVAGSMTMTIGKLDAMYDISGKVVAGFDGMASAIEAIPEYMSYIEVGAVAAAAAVTASLLPALGAAVAVAAAFAISPFGLFVIGAAAAATSLMAINAAFGDVIPLAERLSDVDVSLANTTDIATKAQYGLTQALRARGREMASLDVTNALGIRNDATTKVSALDIEMGAATNATTAYGHFSTAEIEEWRADVKSKLSSANTELTKATTQYELSMDNLAKISDAEIIDYSGQGGGGVAALAKKQAGDIKTALKTLERPIDRLANKGKELKKWLNEGHIDQKTHDKLFSKARDAYKQELDTLEKRSAGYKLQDEANRLLDSHLTTQQQVEKSIANINRLKKAGVLSDAQAIAMIAQEREKAAKVGAGGRKSTLKAADASAISLIEKYGSAADKAQAAANAYGVEMGKVNVLLAKGKIDQETYNNAVDGVKSVYERAKGAAADYASVVGTIMDGVKSTLKGVFSEIFKNGKLTMKSLADMVGNMMNRIFDKVMGLAIDGIFASFGVPTMGKKDGGYIQAFASGGGVRGAGTGRSDSIHAMLSDGEFVVNAPATAKNRAILEQINSGSKLAIAKGGGGAMRAANMNVAALQPIINFKVINHVAHDTQVTGSQNSKGDLVVEITRAVEGQIAQNVSDGISPITPAIKSQLG
ncbi:MAG: tape measure protein [Rhizobiales bacterium]|nr:tape measure protein [Hyphomicrobiales bacterium]NRB15045.1 tape measure protein [Hyphomicrobiales bacterium]